MEAASQGTPRVRPPPPPDLFLPLPPGVRHSKLIQWRQLQCNHSSGSEQQAMLPSLVPTSFGSSENVAVGSWHQKEFFALKGKDVKEWFDRRNGETLRGALAYVPWILQESYNAQEFQKTFTEVHRGEGAVVFADCAGFTSLTERLAGKSNGAELLSKCLTNFYTPLIDLINSYRGDVIKFSGDALTIYYPAVDDTKNPKYNPLVPPHGSFGMADLGPMATAVLRASACCIEIHKRLHNFETGVDSVRLCLCIGVGCGEVAILLVGSEAPPETHVIRREYIIAGKPLEQIAIAEPMAKVGETCLSPEAWHWVNGAVIEGAPLENTDFHLLMRMDESKYTFPTIKHAALENDVRKEKQFGLQQLNVLRQFIPSAVFKQIEGGTLEYVNEMRSISVLFISVNGKDVMTPEGAQQVQELTSNVQKCCYAHEGTMNKFMINDRGMTYLLVWGLPPMVHTDDPTRAMLAAFDLIKVCRGMGIVAQMGLTTGRSYCGVCGSRSRMEYTVLGTCVNLAARLKDSAGKLDPPREVLCDEATKNRGTSEVEFDTLRPIQVKGKLELVPIFVPKLASPSVSVGLTPERTVRFPWYDHPFGGALASGRSETGSMQSNVEQLCGLKSWAGIAKAHELLGVGFSRQQYQKDQTIPVSMSSSSAGKAPAGSPFAEGGVVIIEGNTGYGKVELAEHIVLTAAARFKMYPIMGSMGPRPGGSVQLASEMLRSTLGVMRHVNPSVPKDDKQALAQVVPPQLQTHLPVLHQALQSLTSQTDAEKENILEVTLEVVSALVEVLSGSHPVLITLQYEYGTSLAPEKIHDQIKFWKVTGHLQNLVNRINTSGRSPLVMMIICKDANVKNSAVNKEVVQMATLKKAFIKLGELNQANIAEYMANYLGVTEKSLPQELKTFIGAVTLGNPLFIRESIGQLMESRHIQVHAQSGTQLKRLECGDLKKVDIATWGQTAMVGGTVCHFESLPPLECAVLKMSTCFEGSFTLPDLAASTRSRWADGTTHFDNLRLFKALDKLRTMKILEVVDPPQESGNTLADASGTPADQSRDVLANNAASLPHEHLYGKHKYFKMANVLMRDIGSAMVLEAQRKTVKRQALIERALARALPSRMKALETHKEGDKVRIPWYYEQAFRRMKANAPDR